MARARHTLKLKKSIPGKAEPYHTGAAGKAAKHKLVGWKLSVSYSRFSRLHRVGRVVDASDADDAGVRAHGLRRATS